jgi:hypothetical protein
LAKDFRATKVDMSDVGPRATRLNMHQNPNCSRKRAINVDFGRADQGNISQTGLARRSGLGLSLRALLARHLTTAYTKRLS